MAQVDKNVPKTTASNNSMYRGRGRGGRGAAGLSNLGTSPDPVSGETPVRCSNPHPSGKGYCSTPNFPEAMVCRVCGGRVSHQGAGPSGVNQRGRGGGRGARGENGGDLGDPGDSEEGAFGKGGW